MYGIVWCDEVLWLSSPDVKIMPIMFLEALPHYASVKYIALLTSICAYLCFCASHVIASKCVVAALSNIHCMCMVVQKTAHLKKQNAVNSLSRMHLRFSFRQHFCWYT
uniref:Uncharacterized protein n=1 Tax=Glossina pallidipes TaxID=7398 RepID=A0A1A9ZV69_GLOPL